MVESNVRYLWNWGLAFDERRLLKKLELMAKEGWMLDGMTMLRYRLVKDKPRDLRYAMDYKKLEPEEETEYFSFFEEAAWKHVYSLQGLHFFCAQPDTVPIHTDRATRKEKYSGYKQGSFLTMLISAMLLVVLFGVGQMNMLAFLGAGERVARALLMAGAAVVFAPSLMMFTAYRKRVRDIESEER